jgi:metal-responsive CopG/Arc/MetJ family transcriptional regulator
MTTGILRATLSRVVGRKKLFPSRITLPLPAEMLAAIDAKRGGQPRVEYIRQAIEERLSRKRKSRGKGR